MSLPGLLRTWGRRAFLLGAAFVAVLCALCATALAEGPSLAAEADGQGAALTVSLPAGPDTALVVASPAGSTRTYAMPAGSAPRSLRIAVRDFGYAFGIYNIAAVQDTGSGRELVGTVRVTLRPPGGGTISVRPADSAERAFRAVLEGTDLPDGIPVWFRCWQGSQDKSSSCFEADSQGEAYTALVSAAGCEAGSCRIAAYAGVPGSAEVMVSASSFDISGLPPADVLVSPLPRTPGRFRLSVVPGDAGRIRMVRAAVWSSPDQSDLVWHDMRKDSDLLWRTEDDIAAHGRQMGPYQVHVWADLANGARTLIGTARPDIVCTNYVWTAVSGRNCEVLVQNPASESVRAAVWSDQGGQDDLVWYDAAPAGDGLWRAVVPLRRHTGSGRFTVHVYAGDSCIPSSFDVTAAEMEAAQGLQGLWVPSVKNLDFPTVRGVAAQQTEFRRIVQNASDWGFNALFVQVRPQADALYESSINPWSSVLTGVSGQHPGYDPLAFMVETAHAAGLELHAWLNPYRVGTASICARLAEQSVGRQHPDWLLWYSNAAFLDPARPEVRAHITATVQEIIEKYAVDGIHFDDYFYPYNYPLPDGEARDGATGSARREWVTQMVREVSQVVHASPRKIAFGISPFGVWKNAASDPAGSATRSLESYYSNYCDSVRWVKEGLVDYIAPQLYWELDHGEASYRTLVDWWADVVDGTGVDLIIGQGVYKDGVAAEIREQLALNDTYPQIGGSIFYRYADVRDKQVLRSDLQAWNAGIRQNS